jgi:hypothetical protein
VAERTAACEPGAAIEAEGLALVWAGLEAQNKLAGRACFVLDPAQQRLGQSPGARRRPRVHALDLGIIVEQRNAAAAGGKAIQADHEETHIRFEQSGDRQAVPLMGLVGRAEHVVEFADQVAQLLRWLVHLLNDDSHAGRFSSSRWLMRAERRGNRGSAA